ncbi:MAG: hypothetical protein EOP82_19105 [Variovorax sp.]|nr:MAG: hypothetical protein EOP82_19105 [Variovorax sp.]
MHSRPATRPIFVAPICLLAELREKTTTRSDLHARRPAGEDDGRYGNGSSALTEINNAVASSTRELAASRRRMHVHNCKLMHLA